MAAKKKRKLKAYAFIDTNIFLDFYRSKNETSLSLLKKLESVSERIICTYQVEMEFLKNRHNAILSILDDTKLIINANLPAVMEDAKLSTSLKKDKKNIDRKRKQLSERVRRIIATPASYDPIFRALESIFSSESEHVLTRDMKLRHKIKRLAWRRFMLGYPPRKGNDTSIGDALNWEWLIHACQNLSGKFIIVSRDSDYGTEYNGNYFLNDALLKEFRDRVGKKSIKYTHKLSEALKELEVEVTQEEEQSETTQLRRSSVSSSPGFGGYSNIGQYAQLLREADRMQSILNTYNHPSNVLSNIASEYNAQRQALEALGINESVLEEFRRQEEFERMKELIDPLSKYKD